MSDLSLAKCDAREANRIVVTANTKGLAALSMPFVQGTLGARGSIAGSTITYSFSHRALIDAIRRGRDPFTCVSGNADGDSFYGAFAGRVLHITEENATAELSSALSKHFGATFKNAPRKWVKCPRQEIFPQSSTSAPEALCREFEFGRPGGIYRGGEARSSSPTEL